MVSPSLFTTILSSSPSDIALAIQNGLEFARVVLSGPIVSRDNATGLELIIKAMETPIIILVEAMDIFNVVLKSLTKVIDILNIVLETLTETADIQADSIKTSVKILTDSVNAPIKILIHSIKTLTGIIGVQISGIKTPAEILIDAVKAPAEILIDAVKAPAEILIGVVKAPAEVVEISASSVTPLSEVVHGAREIVELPGYGFETATKDAGIHPNPRSSSMVYFSRVYLSFRTDLP